MFRFLLPVMALEEQIAISKQNKNRLEEHGNMGESYNDVLTRVLDWFEGEEEGGND